jgi:stage II sporulation protein D
MLRFFILLGLFFSGLTSEAQLIRVGLFSNQKISQARFSPKVGSCFIFSDTNFIAKITSPDIIEFSPEQNDKIEIIINGKIYPSVNNISIVQEKNENHLDIKVLKPTLKTRAYEGDFFVLNTKGYLQIINDIDLEQYLEGVIESEAGTGQRIEYYKVQAIISRTYAMKYKKKHESSGFNLCDATHCQAYLHKRNNSDLIDSAVSRTRGVIMLDKNGTMFSTFFHANCGGQTCEPDAVWNEKIEGFSSFKDTFCIHTNQSKWVKKIPIKDWNTFLQDKYNFPIWDTLSVEQMFKFEQIERKTFFINPFFGIPLRDIREAFKLKSTFFSCSKEGDFIVLSGKGFGHGVGLCQEGGMSMAKYGYDYKQILAFYFPGMILYEQPIASFSFRK